MRVPSHDRPVGVAFNVTPMIDIVFLLIIFFLVSSHLASQEVLVELALPEAATGREPVGEQGGRITINVLPDGGILLGGAPVGPEELGRRLTFEAAEGGPDLEVRIRSDRDVAYNFIEPVLIACARAGIWNVGLAVLGRSD